MNMKMEDDSNDKMDWETMEGYSDQLPDCEVLPAPLPDIKSFKAIIRIDDGDEEQQQQLKRTIAKAVACFVLQAYWGLNWGYLKSKVTVEPMPFCSLREAVFKSMTKFILRIFDMEDFQRVDEVVSMNLCYKEFYKRVCAEFGSCSEQPAFSAMRAISERNSRFDMMKEFPFLQEQDVDYVLEWYHYEFDKNVKWVQEAGPCIHNRLIMNIPRLYEHHVRAVLETMDEYVPLEEEHKMNLMMEMERESASHIVDAFYREAMNDIPMHVLENDRNIEYVEDLSVAIMENFYYLANEKAKLLRSLKRVATFPLVCGVFGAIPFSKEVVELVWIANIKRLQDGQRFLRLRHMMSGFSRSRIADRVKRIIKEGGQTIPDHMLYEEDLLDTNLVYYIYKSSRDVARVFGSKEIGLEHLFLATVFRRQQIDDNDWIVIVGKEAVVEFLEECVQRNKHSRGSKEEATPFGWRRVTEEQRREEVNFLRSQLVSTQSRLESTERELKQIKSTYEQEHAKQREELNGLRGQLNMLFGALQSRGFNLENGVQFPPPSLGGSSCG